MEPAWGARIVAWAQAIQAYEGWRPGSLSQRHHNPGNLRQWGTLPREQGYVVFPDDEAGMRALCTLLSRAASGQSHVYRPDMTLAEFFAVYSPAVDANHPADYAAFVAHAVGAPVSTPLSWFVADAAAAS
jgi:hypothetical protein